MQRRRMSVLAAPLQRLLRMGARANASNMLSKLHTADVARLLAFLTEDENREAFELVLTDDPKRAAEVLAELDTNEAVRYLEDKTDSAVATIVGELPSDDAAELVAALPQGLADRILSLSAQEGELQELLQYEEETAGRIMSVEVFSLHEDVLVGKAIAALRTSRSEELEMVFYLYTIDHRGHLVGVCSLRDLLLSEPEVPLKAVMNSSVVAVNVLTDQEEVARTVARYNYLAVPVVDDENKLEGIITVDDVIDIMREEETEDILLMAGVGEDEEEVLTAPLWRNAWLRLPWMFAAWIGGMFASQVIGQFEDLLNQVIALAAFIPVIVGMGGNVGIQASTIVVRGLATGRLAPGQAFNAVFREVRVALLLGILFGSLLALSAYLLVPDKPGLGVVVGLAITTSMVLASTVGAFTPILLHRLGIDPAVATGPFVTTSIDVLGVIAYFSIATLVLL